MLQFIRENASNWVVKVGLWGLAATFVGSVFLFGALGGNGDRQTAATVGSTVITNAQLNKRYDQLVENITRAGGSVPDDYLTRTEMKKAALNEMIMENLEVMAAKEAGFDASNEEVRDTIVTNPNFQIAGQFDKDLYFGIMRNNGLSPQEYENVILPHNIMAVKITRLITDSVMATKAEIKDEFQLVNEKVKVEYMIIAPALYEFNVKINDEAVLKYFDKHSDEYTLPETREFEYLSVDPKKLAESVDITDKEIKDYYERRKAEFTTEEQVHARHILFALDPNASIEKSEGKKKKAEEVLKELNEGADFAELAKKYSDGPTAAKGGDLGFFGRGQMVQEFEREVFSMEPGKISGPVRTQFGYHIIKLEEKRPAAVIDFKSVKEFIKGKLFKEKSGIIAKKRLAALTAVKPGKKIDWKELAKTQGLVYGTDSAWAGKDTPNLPGSLHIADRLFKLKVGDKAGPFELPGGIYFVRLLNIKAPHKPELLDVRTVVEKDYKTQESAKMAEATAAEFLKRLREGAKLSDLSKETGLNVKISDWVKRDGTIKGESSSDAIINRAFEMKPGEQYLLNSGGKIYIMNLVDRKKPSEDELADQRVELAKKVTEKKRNRVIRQWRNSLRKKAMESGTLEIDMEYL
ncbi:MAG: peptidyl-prolyl cis-trans isomerase [Nitrospinota bacterium]